MKCFISVLSGAAALALCGAAYAGPAEDYIAANVRDGKLPPPRAAAPSAQESKP